MKIHITGDTHADFRRFSSQYFEDKECYVIFASFCFYYFYLLIFT